MKKHVWLLILLFLASPVFAGKVVPLPDLLKPENIIVHQDRILITEFPQVYMYTLKDFKLIKKFGKAGQGPQEFLNYARVQVHPDDPDFFFVCSRGKISFFTREGTFVKEIRSKTGASTYKPVGKKYAAYGFLRENNVVYNTVDIYDAHLGRIKEVTRWKRIIQPGKSFDPTDTDTQGGEFRTDGKNIFVLLRKKGDIHVFDPNGEKRFSIGYNYEQVPVTPVDIQGFHHFYKTNPEYSPYYEAVKSRFKFPSYFPSARTMVVADHKVYVLTNKREGVKSEFVILGTGGKFLKKSMVPFENVNPLAPYPFTIHDGKLFQLFDNEDTEKWELHIHPVL